MTPPAPPNCPRSRGQSTPLASAIVLLLLGSANGASAQEQIQGVVRQATIAFQSGSATSDGYESGSIPVSYRFLSCARELYVAYAPHGDQISAASGYWHAGERHPVPDGIAPPRFTASMGLNGVAERNGQVVGRFGDGAASMRGSLTCGSGNVKRVAALPEVIRRASPGEVQGYLNSIHARFTTSMHLTSGAVRSAILAQRREAEQRAAEERRREEERQRAQAREREQPRQAAAAEGGQAQRQTQQQQAQAAADAQLMQRGQELLTRAEGLYRQRNYDSARALYEQILNGPSQWEPYKITARQRMKYMADQQMVELTAEALVLIGGAVAPVLGSLANHMSEEYPGLFFGAHYQSSPFAGGHLGWTMGFNLEGVPIAPYFEMGFGVGGSDLRESASIAFAIGGAFHRYGWTGLGAQWAPHIGYRMVTTHRDFRQFGDSGRVLNFLTVGLSRFGGGSYMRTDALIVAGKPHLGGSLGIMF
jgi:hypothetical protein